MDENTHIEISVSVAMTEAEFKDGYAWYSAQLFRAADVPFSKCPNKWIIWILVFLAGLLPFLINIKLGPFDLVDDWSWSSLRLILPPFVLLGIALMIGAADRSLRFTSFMYSNGVQYSRPYRLRLKQKGVIVEGEDFSGIYHWSLTAEVQKTSTFVFLFMNKVNCLMIPLRCFTDRQHCDAFVARVQERIGQTRA